MVFFTYVMGRFIQSDETFLSRLIYSTGWGRCVGNHKHLIPKIAPPAMFRPITRQKSIREQFAELPAQERFIMAAQVAKLNADPNSEVFMRAAVTDYNQRVKNAITSAKNLDASTVVAAPLDEQSARSLRL